MYVCSTQRVSSDRDTDTSVVLVVAGVLTAECREFWQLLLCQGILTGFACGMIFGSIPAIVAQWFEKRRSLAFGIVAAGSALGGTIIPIAARNLIELIGYASASHERRTRLTSFFSFKWTMRVVALIELFALAVANLVRILISGVT
jgi:MCP family monocarboxylic acid transporter-like MFS transporter 10